ncbi:MAG: hypothetical protein R3C99_00745 [Pirellulaceae bacterium]
MTIANNEVYGNYSGGINMGSNTSAEHTDVRIVDNILHDKSPRQFRFWHPGHWRPHASCQQHGI